MRIHSFTPFTQLSLVEFTIYFSQSFETELRVLGELINIPSTLPTASNNSDQIICHVNKMCLRLSTIYRLWHLFHPFPCLTYSCKWKIYTITPKGIFTRIPVAALKKSTMHHKNVKWKWNAVFLLLHWIRLICSLTAFGLSVSLELALASLVIWWIMTWSVHYLGNTLSQVVMLGQERKELFRGPVVSHQNWI